MKSGTVSVIEPIARIEGEQLDFRPLGQLGGFVDNKSAGANTCLDGHVNEAITGGAAQQAVAAGGGWRDNEPPRLNRHVRPRLF